MTPSEIQIAKKLCEALKTAPDIASHIAYLRDYARFLPKAFAYIEELESHKNLLESNVTILSSKLEKLWLYRGESEGNVDVATDKDLDIALMKSVKKVEELEAKLEISKEALSVIKNDDVRHYVRCKDETYDCECYEECAKEALEKIKMMEVKK